MKHGLKRFLSLTLATALSVCVSMTTFAENENNTLGVTFNASLSQSTLTESDQDQSVTLYVNASAPVTLNGMQMQLVQGTPLKVTAIAGGDNQIQLTRQNYNLSNGMITWRTDDVENIAGVTDLVVATVKVPANAPAGTYKIGAKNFELTNVEDGNYAHVWENKAAAYTTLTINAKPADGYTTGVTTLNGTPTLGDTVLVNINASHTTDKTFAAAELAVQYDSSKLLFKKDASTLGEATVKEENGTIKIEDYGEEKNLGNGIYVLAFETKGIGATDVTLTAAAFVNKADAVKKDLIKAGISGASVNFVIARQTYQVTLPDFFTGNSTVTDGDDYTFTQVDKEHYTYTNVKATVNGGAVEVIDNCDGTYTVENVTGPLVITGTRTAKSYDVTFAGDAKDDIVGAAATATYLENYSFTMPTVEGWAYTVDEITIGGVKYTNYAREGAVYTIPGADVTGDIQITVSKSATIANVTVEGNGAGAAEGYEKTVGIGEDYTLKLRTEEGYIYTVEATIDGKPVDVTKNDDGTYTVQNVTGKLAFKVTRTVVTDDVTVSKYVAVDSTNVWLIQKRTAGADGTIPAYDNAEMFWSDKYQAYCYLVIAPEFTRDEAVQKISIATGSKNAVVYDGDVNMTKKVDASDAQLTYNLYNAEYKEFTDDMTMEKFLRADVNGDAKVDVEDAAAIIAQLLG